MTLEELLSDSSVALTELTAELFVRCDESMRFASQSQRTACLLLGLRAASLLNGMSSTLQPVTMDSFDTLCRAYTEARDLLMTFRFDDGSTRTKIGYWFAGRRDSSWKPNHGKLDEHLTRLGAKGLELATNWSKQSALAHPTKYAAENSAVIVRGLVTRQERDGLLAYKRMDYISCVSRLAVAVTYELNGWISLGCDIARLPHVESFHQSAEHVAMPVLNQPSKNPLPAVGYKAKYPSS